MRDLPNITTSDDDLLPLANPARVGLPFSRRTLGDRIVAKKFPPVIRIGNRLYIQRSVLDKYKKKLIEDGGERNDDSPALVETGGERKDDAAARIENAAPAPEPTKESPPDALNA